MTLQIYNFFQCLFQAQLKFAGDIDLPFPLTKFNSHWTQMSIFVIAMRQEFFSGSLCWWMTIFSSLTGRTLVGWGGWAKKPYRPQQPFPLISPWCWVVDVPRLLPGSPRGEVRVCALSQGEETSRVSRGTNSIGEA